MNNLNIICCCNKIIKIPIYIPIFESDIQPCQCMLYRIPNSSNMIVFYLEKYRIYYNFDKNVMVSNKEFLKYKRNSIKFNYNNNPLNLNDILNKYNNIINIS